MRGSSARTRSRSRPVRHVVCESWLSPLLKRWVPARITLWYDAVKLFVAGKALIECEHESTKAPRARSEMTADLSQGAASGRISWRKGWEIDLESKRQPRRSQSARSHQPRHEGKRARDSGASARSPRSPRARRLPCPHGPQCRT